MKSVAQGHAENSKGNVKHVIEPAAWKYPLAAICGTNILPDAKKYNYWEETSLTAKESKSFKKLCAGGMKPSDAWKAVRGNDDASKLSTAAVDANSEADGEPKETLGSQSAAQESRSTVGVQSKSEALIVQLG